MTIPVWVVEVTEYCMDKQLTGKLTFNLVDGGIASIDNPEHWTEEKWQKNREALLTKLQK